MTDNNKITLLLYGGSRFDKSKKNYVAIFYKIYKNNWKILWIHFRIKFRDTVNAAINIFSDLSWFLHILLFNLFLFCFCFVFFVTIFRFHGNLHYCYRGTAECIFSRIYFCEHITMEKKNMAVGFIAMHSFHVSCILFCVDVSHDYK